MARQNLKMSPRFFDLFKVLEWNGKVAYKLGIPTYFVLHTVFHILVLKKKLRQQVAPTTLLPMDYDDELVLEPHYVIQRLVHKHHNHVCIDVLVQWEGAAIESTTWELYW